MLKTTPTLIVSSLVWICSASSAAPVAVSEAGNYHVVTANLSRSARPAQADLADLAQQGFRTIIDLENDADAIAQERQWAADLGLRFISSPIDSFQPVDAQQIDGLLQLLQRRDLSKVLVHCQAGKDRTGMIIGLYRVLVQHWQPADAYSEMLYFGFTPGLRELDDFYKNRTGWHPVFRAPIPQYQ